MFVTRDESVRNLMNRSTQVTACSDNSRYPDLKRCRMCSHVVGAFDSLCHLSPHVTFIAK